MLRLVAKQSQGPHLFSLLGFAHLIPGDRV